MDKILGKKVLAFDLDGTLSQHRSHLTDEAKETLRKLSEKYKLIMLGAGNCRRIFTQMEGFPIDIIGNYGMQYGKYNSETGEIDIVKALDLGAEDYIKKPFGILEMVSRVKAVLRRCEKKDKSQQQLVFGNILMDKERHIVTVCGKQIDFTLKEYYLLKLFMENPHKVFSREHIMDAVWGESYVGESRTVDMHIKTLRQKLGDMGDAIVTIRGVGYKMEEVKK